MDGSEIRNIGKNRNAVETAMTSAVEAMNGSSRVFSCFSANQKTATKITSAAATT